MIRRALSIALLVSVMLMAACAGSGHSVPAQPTDDAATIRSQGYSLLYATIDDESQVDKVLIIKRAQAPVTELIKAIGQFCRDAKSTLELLAKEAPAIALDNQGLPQAEAKTREAISSSTSKKILFSSGKELEFTLLLTQHEALNYIIHVADTIADEDPRDNRKRYLKTLSKEATALHERVLTQLKTPYVGQAK
jgi:hypothetical protein